MYNTVQQNVFWRNSCCMGRMLWNLINLISDRKLHLLSTCGFCGMSNCSVDLKVTSTKGSNKCYSIISNCPYTVKFSLKSAENTTRANPTTNRPVYCPTCCCVLWSYNQQLHNIEDHGATATDENTDTYDMVTTKEKNFVLKRL